MKEHTNFSKSGDCPSEMPAPVECDGSCRCLSKCPNCKGHHKSEEGGIVRTVTAMLPNEMIDNSVTLLSRL